MERSRCVTGVARPSAAGVCSLVVPLGSGRQEAGHFDAKRMILRCAEHTKQLLHLVFGGELAALDKVDFTNLAALDIVGIFPSYAEAHKAWKAAAQRTVDNAHMRYFIVHIHRLMDPEDRDEPAARTGRLSRRRAKRGRAGQPRNGEVVPVRDTDHPRAGTRRRERLSLDARTRGLLRRFLADWVWPRWPRLLGVLALMGLLAAATGAYPSIIKISFDTLMKGEHAVLPLVLAAIVGVTLVRSLLLYAQNVSSNPLSSCA